jgi:hypothetical protein
VAALIAAQRDAHQIPHATACRALGVSRSWFYKHKDRSLTPREARREALAAKIGRLFRAHRGTYGSPRVTADLRAAGWQVSQNTVAAVMGEQGLAARRTKKRRATTRPGKGRWRAPDLVKRDFPAQKINTKWYGDGTEIPTGQGKLYLSVTWNHHGVAPCECRGCPVASLRAGGDGGPAGDGCGDVWQVAGSGAARAGC